MAQPRVHSSLPGDLAEVLGIALGRAVVHVDHGVSDVMGAAAEAARDDRAVAFVGPLLSWQVAETAAVLNQSGLAQLAVGATYAGLTRDEPGAEDGMPASLRPSGHCSLFRLVPRDTALCRALVAEVGGPCVVVGDDTPYGAQLDEQLALAGLERTEDPAAAVAVVYAGLADRAPMERLAALGGLGLWGFEGAAEGDFPARLDGRARFLLPQHPVPGWTDEAILRYFPQAVEAGMLVVGSLLAGGPDRVRVAGELRGCGRFDAFGDTVERRCGVWRWEATGRLAPDRTALVPD